jgi:hypothetical protein
MNVIATLSCAWCGRETHDVALQLNRLTGRMAAAHFDTSRPTTQAKPRCVHCAGPQFVVDWEPAPPPVKAVDLRGIPGRPRKHPVVTAA